MNSILLRIASALEVFALVPVQQPGSSARHTVGQPKPAGRENDARGVDTGELTDVGPIWR